MNTKNILLNTKNLIRVINDNDINKLKGNIFHLIMSKIKLQNNWKLHWITFFKQDKLT